MELRGLLRSLVRIRTFCTSSLHSAIQRKLAVIAGCFSLFFGHCHFQYVKDCAGYTYPCLSFYRTCASRGNRVAAERGFAVIVNQPLERGDLFLRIRRHALPDWAREPDFANWAKLFLKYILAEPAVTCVIPATGNPDHMKDNLGAGFGSLPDVRQRRQLRELWDTL